MKKIISLVLVLIFTLSFVGCTEQSQKPYKNLKASDIVSATVTLSPPNKTIQIDDIEKLVSLLNDIVIYEKDNSYGEYYGQSVLFTLTMTDGSTQELLEYNPFVVINGTGYKIKYKPCEKINKYANKLLNKELNITEQ